MRGFSSDDDTVQEVQLFDMHNDSSYVGSMYAGSTVLFLDGLSSYSHMMWARVGWPPYTMGNCLSLWFCHALIE